MTDQIPVRLAIAGALGRMGQAVAKTAQGRDDVRVAARFDREAGGELVSRNDAVAEADAVIDFTGAGASSDLVAYCAGLGRAPALIIGSTGFSPEQEAAIRADQIRGGLVIVKAGNFSLGVNVLASLVRKAAAMLPDYDIEILEMHHARKVDAPSGTALLLGEAAARGRDIALRDHSVRVRDGHTGPREPGTIGFATLRGGTVVGDHSVILAGPAERIELNHRAEDRSMFASGAARAALWAAGKPAGLYSMADVLGLD